MNLPEDHQTASKPIGSGPKPNPRPGRRYRFMDFIGAEFVATLKFVGKSGDGKCIRLEFEDRGPFETNMPMDYEDAD